MERYWLGESAPKHPDYHPISDVEYVGITELSVEVHTRDGRCYRVTNPNFDEGLKLEIREEES